MAGVTMDAERAQDLIHQTTKLARSSGWRRLRFGAVLTAEEAPDGTRGWRVSTKRGEQLWLTNALLWAAGGCHWWLQGRTTCSIAPADIGPAEDLADDLQLAMYHAPAPGPAGAELAVVTDSIIRVATAERPLVILSTARPAGWPP